jgi:hypothetical protein
MWLVMQVAMAAEPERGYFGVRTGVAAGWTEGKVLPASLLGMEAGYELGRQRGHLVNVDMELLLSQRYLTQRLSLGYALQAPAGALVLSLGPRLWLAELRGEGEVLVEAAPGASLAGGLRLPLEHWWLVVSGEVGRGLGGWSSISPQGVSHWKGQLGLSSSNRLGMSVGVQQVGELRMGLLTFGVGL